MFLCGSLNQCQTFSCMHESTIFAQKLPKTESLFPFPSKLCGFAVVESQKPNLSSFFVSAEILQIFPNLCWLVQNDFTAQQQAHEMKSVIAGACSHKPGYAVVLFNMIENITELQKKWLHLIKLFKISGVTSIFYGFKLTYLLTWGVFKILLKFYCI